MKKWIFLSTVLLALSGIKPANAAPEVFAGKWVGKGTYILEGRMTQCADFEMVFGAARNTFTFVSGHRVCDSHSEQFYPVTMQVKEGQILFNGQVVGTYVDNKMDVSFSMPDEKGMRHWRMSMRREGDTMIYEESRTMNQDSTPVISFAGLLQIQNKN